MTIIDIGFGKTVEAVPNINEANHKKPNLTSWKKACSIKYLNDTIIVKLATIKTQ
jgi:hypothetical protein